MLTRLVGLLLFYHRIHVRRGWWGRLGITGNLQDRRVTACLWNPPVSQSQTAPFNPSTPISISLVKTTTIYPHHTCISYFLTPVHLYKHQRNAHPDSTQTVLGQQALDVLVIHQELYTPYQPGAKHVYLCSSCQMIVPTSFAAKAHLEKTQQNDAEVQHARWIAGHAGVA